ncbi:MAG: branched-chain amino acid ABC transporter permease [Pseudomonadota bacterium]|uniref:branched-chain amino acid ABC transporter permease n=1 Tax=Roseovarius TaxID=74030 RepID=UPI0022A8C7EA|nr:branched-chain amino acid ABC transporter permease [Roseovarius sp. EGI FJ00037]MCZ0813008.1 branched-chain amino acid ABC transporter permease [Roseovarius sp. EGI FJ00037]
MRNLSIFVLGGAALLALPHGLSFSQQEILVFLTLNILLVSSYRLLTLTGEWSLAHVVIMGVGAYASALYTKELGIWVPVSILLGGATAALLAVFLSFPLFRMKGFYFLIGSFAAGEIIRLLWKRFRDPFGGAKGIKGIDPMPDFSIGIYDFDFFEPVSYYYLSVAVVAVCLWILWRIERSPVGLTFHAVHWQDRLAEASGVNLRAYRTLAFSIASGFAGISGALMAHYVGTINPTSFDVDLMVFVLTWAIVGGTATFYGPILGCVVLTVLNEIVLREMGFEQLRPLIYGLIMILSILFLPKGLESLVQKLASKRPGKGTPERSPAE